MATVQLVRAGVDVTLLEAGTADAARGFTATLGGWTAIRLHRSLSVRSEGVTATGDPGALLYEDLSPGGLTNHWSCAVPRFSEEDFLDARRAGEAFTWPIEYNDLACWYNRVEPLLSIAGAASDVPQLVAGRGSQGSGAGQELDAGNPGGTGKGSGTCGGSVHIWFDHHVTRSGTVFNSFVRLVRPEMGTGRLDVTLRGSRHTSGMVRRYEASDRRRLSRYEHGRRSPRVLPRRGARRWRDQHGKAAAAVDRRRLSRRPRQH